MRALIAVLACAPPPAPPPPVPPVPPPTDAEACRAGDSEACVRVRAAAEVARSAGAFAAAADGYETVCVGRPEDAACVLVGRVRALASDRRAACGATRHPASCAEVDAALAADCGRKDGVACRIRGEAVLSGALPGTSAEAAALLWAGCAADEGWSCLALAELGDRGEPLPPGTRGDAAWLRAQACDLHVEYACAPHVWGPTPK